MFLTTALTDGASKRPQVGTEYSNDYIAKLTKQGLSQDDVMARLTERDLELPHEVDLHYYLYALKLSTGGIDLATRMLRSYPISLDFGTGSSPVLVGE